MIVSLDEVCAILDELEKEIAEIQTIWRKQAESHPHLEQASSENCQEEYHRMWLHGATNVWERNELERWLYGDLPATKTALSPAIGIYKAWRKWLKISGLPKFGTTYDYDKKTSSWREVESKEPSDTYYATNNRFDIEKPSEDETLLDCIVRLAQSIEDKGKGHPLEYRGLKSFVDFIRNTYSTEQIAFIEHIFPKKMDLHFGKIIRLISSEAYPIPEKTAAEILIELARRSRNGRPDARHTAIESLALCLLCIATSRIRLPKTLEMVRDIKTTAVLSGTEFSLSTKPTYGGDAFWRPLIDSDFSVLLVPTWFGEQPLKISNRWAALLKAISRLPSKSPRKTILQKPRRSLARMFDQILKTVAPNPEYGNITYLSLLQQPHIFGDHRPQPKYKNIK
jgi:hypothetical protein